MEIKGKRQKPSFTIISATWMESKSWKWPAATEYHDGVITHLEPDTLEYEVKWALGSITTNKASGGDGIPVSYFKS